MIIQRWVKGYRRQSLFYWIVAIFSIFLLQACGSNVDSQSSNHIDPRGTLELSRIGAVWATECLYRGEGVFSRQILKFAQSGIEITRIAYGDIDCVHPMIEARTLTNLRPTQLNDRQFEVQREAKSVLDIFLTPQNEGLLKEMNAGRYCGWSDWKNPTSHSVKGTDCFDELVGPAHLRIHYDISDTDMEEETCETEVRNAGRCTRLIYFK